MQTVDENFDLGEVVKKAIAGGWRNEYKGFVFKADIHSGIFLERVFWECLGREVGWNLSDPQMTAWQHMPRSFGRCMYVYDHTPAFYQHLFIDWINSGNSMVSFFKKYKVI